MNDNKARSFSLLVAALCVPLLGAVAMAGDASPYRGEEVRNIKALSEQEIEAYLSGQGMGYAKAAELNSYPGPKHVLELARELGLTPAQEEQLIEIALLDGQLRRTHLAAHLEQKILLSSKQVTHYMQLRGYESSQGHDAHHGH
jgi:hypothetical protein